MAHPVRIEVGPVVLEAELFDTPSALGVLDSLPFEGPFETWGDEFYFQLPVALPSDDTATMTVHIGDIGYWPSGQALAIFFGPTPISEGPDPVPASEVNLVGRVLGDARQLSGVASELLIRLTRE